jgi:hypothetical protein
VTLTDPRRGTVLLAVGRVALGVAVLAAPEQVTSRWLGDDNAAKPVVIDLARSLGARDLALGLAVLQTLDDPVVGPRVQAACAMVDGVDAAATMLAREHLPRSGAIGTIVVATAATAAGLYFSHRLAHSR